AVGVAVWQGVKADACAGAPERLVDIWGASQRAALGRAFSSEALKATGALVRERVDRWAVSWAQARTEACQATVRHEQSEQLLDKRMHCFDAQARQTRALLAVLVDPTLTRRALETVEALPDVEECSS